MGLRNRSFTDEQFIEAVETSYSIAETLRKLSLKAAGANYRMFRILSKKMNIDHSHFTGQGHLKGKTHSWHKKIPIEEILVENSSYCPSDLKKRLIKDGYFKYECYKQNCNISEWHDEYLSLHLDHINGINTDNRIENLRLLCPNCHSQTPTYAGKNKKGAKKPIPEQIKKMKKQYNCKYCGILISCKAMRCRSCSTKDVHKTKIHWPPTQELIRMVEQSNYTQVGKQLGVSDSAIRKRIKQHP